MSAPTGTETTHTGHERDVDLSVFLTLKSAKIKGERRPPVAVRLAATGLSFEYTEKNGGV